MPFLNHDHDLSWSLNTYFRYDHDNKRPLILTKYLF